jgi:propionyl-CoA synthetase
MWCMGDSDAAWANLGADPGLCRACQHAKPNLTRRGTAYLRCARAAWDPALTRYPRLPVTECPGFEENPRSAGTPHRTPRPP